MIEKESVNPNYLFILDNTQYNTRGHNLKLYVSKSRLELRKNFSANG